MNDTPEHIRQIQREIFQKMTPSQRLELGIQMMDDGRKLVESRIRAEHPEWSQGEIVAAVCEQFYKKEFSPEEMNRIKQSIISYHQNQ